jgi:hypothetical protein
MPAKCVSSISPRFHYKRLAFCFLTLAAILESSLVDNLSDINNSMCVDVWVLVISENEDIGADMMKRGRAFLKGTLFLALWQH